MKLSTWRPRLLLWLNKNITISSWVLDRPDTVLQTMGFLPPLRDTEYVLGENKEVYLDATQDFMVLKRFGSENGYKDLPVNQMEGLVATLAYRFLLDRASIDVDVLNLEAVQVSQPIKVEEVGEGDGEWILELTWSLKVRLLVDPETPIVPDWNITSIRLNVWKDAFEDDLTDGISDPTLRVLDWQHQTP